jgi:hypothetical protein
MEFFNSFGMQLYIPNPQNVAESDIHYISSEEAVKQSFSDDHQSSSQNLTRENNNVVAGDVVLVNQEPR